MPQDERWRAWYVQAKMNARLAERIAGELERRTRLPAGWIDVLATLRDEPKRMNELADDLILSRGGATRLIARMEAAGLVVRETPAHDRRATFAVITPAGRRAVDHALPIHLDVVEELYGRHLDSGDAETVLRVAMRICDAHGWPDQSQASAGSSTPSSSQL